MSITTKEAAKALRTALKKVGVTSRHVSVRSESFSGGSALNVTIKDPSIRVSDVNDAAKVFERIRRCEYSGEILSGCNRYVSVSYSHEVEEELKNRVKDAAKVAFEKALANRARLIDIEGFGFAVSVSDTGDVSSWKKTDDGYAHNVKCGYFYPGDTSALSSVIYSSAF